MKKQFTIFLILVFILGLTPVNFSNAITQNQIDAEVQIVCTDGSDNWFSGSGTIIDPKGIILTNRHVVEGAYMNTCFIGFIESISQEPNFGTAGNYNLAEVKYQTVSNDMDAAILYLDNPTNKIYPYINIWDSNSDALQFGDKIEVIGFPSIGGSTITYTSGDFSGFGSSADGTQNYIKSTAMLEHGNSGGAAYNSNGQFVGIPTMVIVGTLNSMNYILSINSIKDWLEDVLGIKYQDEIPIQVPEIDDNVAVIPNDSSPPDIYKVGQPTLSFSDYSDKYSPDDIYVYEDFLFFWDFSKLMAASPDTKYIYVYYGKDFNANPTKSGKKYATSQFTEYVKYISENYTINDKEEIYYFILQVVDQNNNYSDKLYWRYQYYPSLTDTSLAIPDYFNIYESASKNHLIAKVEYTTGILNNIKIPNNEIYVEWFYSDNESHHNINSFEIQLTSKPEVTKRFYGQQFVSFTGGNKVHFAGINKNQKYYFSMLIPYQHKVQRDGLPQDLLQVISSDVDEVNLFNTAPAVAFSFTFEDNNTDEYNYQTDLNLSNRLKGYILLQVEQNGEAYYIYPDDSKRYYLGRPADAFNAMRELGLGATHQFINSYTIYPDHVLGKILIDVEQNGEAYYIYPKDKKAYYLGRPADAFRIMRELGLGITNDDLSKIPEGSL